MKHADPGKGSALHFISSHNMAYSNLNFERQLQKLENAEIKIKIRLYEKTKKRIIFANYACHSFKSNMFRWKGSIKFLPIYMYICVHRKLSIYIYIYT